MKNAFRMLVLVTSLFFYSCETMDDDVKPTMIEQSTDGTDDPDCKADCDDPD